VSPIKALITLELLCWPTILIGIKRGWLSRKDVSDFAVDLLIKGNGDEDVALIASASSLQDDELFNWISNRFKQADMNDALDKWRLAYLLTIAESEDGSQAKIDRLQEIYANFDYPEDMASCSIYSQDEIDPLVAMMYVIENLRFKLSVASKGLKHS